MALGLASLAQTLRVEEPPGHRAAAVHAEVSPSPRLDWCVSVLLSPPATASGARALSIPFLLSSRPARESLSSVSWARATIFHATGKTKPTSETSESNWRNRTGQTSSESFSAAGVLERWDVGTIAFMASRKSLAEVVISVTSRTSFSVVS